MNKEHWRYIHATIYFENRRRLVFYNINKLLPKICFIIFRFIYRNEIVYIGLDTNYEE